MKTNKMKTDPNTPAFACSDEKYLQPGLTKREYFAAMAMQGLLSNARLGDTCIKQYAKDAVLHADNLIEELNKGGDDE